MNSSFNDATINKTADNLYIKWVRLKFDSEVIECGSESAADTVSIMAEVAVQWKCTQ